MSRATTQNFDRVSNGSLAKSMLIDCVLLLYVHGHNENVRNIFCFCEGEREAVAEVDIL